MGTETAWSPSFFRMSFVFNRRKKVIQVWNDTRVSKRSQNVHFGVNGRFEAHRERENW